ncbi:MAG: trimeric intracellular cation channel family protein [Bacteroidota bacterium]
MGKLDLITIIDYTGTLVFAISGVMAGVDRKFDFFGVFILGFVTALGGGTIRDVLIGSTPVGWMQNEIYVLIVSIAVGICFFAKNLILKIRRGFFLFDTIGIGLFTILGLEKTLSVGLSPIIAIMMGVVSACFGGVTRDVLSNHSPLIFSREIYASACFAGAVSYLILKTFFSVDVSMTVSILIVIFIRVMAIRKHWSLPFNA